MSDDYPAGGDPGFNRLARFMVGESLLSPGYFDERLWELTAQSGKPLAWREPLQTNSGLRLLLPHRARKVRASYVSAIRADIHLENQFPGSRTMLSPGG